jgi:hypothetical protein
VTWVKTPAMTFSTTPRARSATRETLTAMVLRIPVELFKPVLRILPGKLPDGGPPGSLSFAFPAAQPGSRRNH